jgi:translation initiation factor IF-3
MIHEVRLRPRTGQHDIDLKVRIAKRLLGEGDKVKLAVMFRGREISHPEVGREVLDKAIAGIGEEANMEKPPGMEGRFLTAIVTPAPKKPAPREHPEGQAPAPEGDDDQAEPEATTTEEVATEAEAEATTEPAAEGEKAADAGDAPAVEDKKAEAAATARKNEG